MNCDGGSLGPEDSRGFREMVPCDAAAAFELIVKSKGEAPYTEHFCAAHVGKAVSFAEHALHQQVVTRRLA